MIVTLLTHTPDPLRVLFTAAHTCYSPKSAEEIWRLTAPGLTAVKGDEPFSTERQLKTVRGCIVRGHNTVIRHAVFTFALDGISRACATQLTRHGPGWFFHDGDLDAATDEPPFDQQSLRYVRMDTEPEWVIPEHLSEQNHEAMRTAAEEAFDWYRRLIGVGIKPEDARAVLPLCTPCNLVATVNLAALFHFWHVRAMDTTGKAQAEIKTLAGLMIAEVIAAEPWLGEFFKAAQ